MLKLQFKDQRKPAIWLVESRYAIGRDPQNSIVLADESVSPFHAELRIEGDQVFITDTGSAGGTLVNGKRIQRRTELRASDVISIQGVELVLVDPKEVVTTSEGATQLTPALANIPVASAGAKPATGWTLRAKTGSIVGKIYTIPAAGKVVVGRANNCDIQLPANQVSRQHAELQLVAGKLQVRDLNSSNGTYINRKKISEGELKNGDEVRFDTFSFEVTGPGGSTTAQKPVGDDSSTQMRSPAPGTAATPPLKSAAAPVPGKTSTVAPTRVQPKMDAPPPPAKSGGGGVVVILLLVAVAAGAAWFFLK